MIKTGVIGATGYAGQQLVWLLNSHEDVEIVFLSSYNYANKMYNEVYINYFGVLENKCIYMENAYKKLEEIDLLFIALPHGKSFDIVKKALSLGVKVIDLGADYRLKSTSEYKMWYEIEHQNKEALNKAEYGLSELNREAIKKSNLVANPGCYPTASILALTPLIKKELIDLDSIIIDAKSGVSGAGRKSDINSLYAECNESVKAYGVATHRHTPEIEQQLSFAGNRKITLSFTPHLIPMTRGILATCYAKLNKKIKEKEIKQIYKEFYKDEYFIKILDTLPETRWVKGSNICHIGIKVDYRTGRVIVVSAIDNLIKGAAGGAVQNMNLMFGLKENKGLEFIAMAP